LEKSNHDHLGKVLTYLTAFDAKTGVWIVSDARAEHIKAIGWLNETTAASFYLVKVEAIKIGDSDPAPLFTLIVGPSEESRVVGETKKEMAEWFAHRQQFWTSLLERAKEKTDLHAESTPVRQYFLRGKSSKPGIWFVYIIRNEDACVEFLIDRGLDAAEENEAIFAKLMNQKGEIDRAFGEALQWEGLEGKRVCRVRKWLQVGGLKNEDKWPEIQDAMIDAMIRLEEAFRPHIARLEI
jgi:hypothetical protein